MTETAAATRKAPADDEILIGRICTFIAEALDCDADEVAPDADVYRDLKLDSLGSACVFVDMAYEFGTPEPSTREAYASLNTARKMMEYVRAQYSLDC